MQPALARAWQLHQAGERDAAERGYRELLAHAPDDADALNCFGILLMQTARAAEAHAAFARAARHAPEQHAFHANLARAALRLGDADAALQASEAALAHGAGAGAWLLRAVALRDLDRIDDARDSLRDALQRHPGDYALRYNLAVTELAAGDAAVAVAQLQALLAAHPRDANAWLVLGNALAARDELAASEDAYRNALRHDATVAGGWRLLGITQLQRGDARAAVASLRFALQQQRCDQAALAALGVAATLCGDPAAATLLDFDRVVQAGALDPDASAAAGLGFHVALAAEILAQTSLRYDRAQKTTRDGGQTGNLVACGTPMLRRFIEQLHAELARRIEAMAASFAQAAHPLAATQPTRWVLNLWATVLREHGRQEPHLHPSGWLSGVYYVALPGIDAAQSDGWIEFGAPPATLSTDARHPTRRRQPRVGELVTFPSYLYHRTLPHRGSALRISLAFDVVPQD